MNNSVILMLSGGRDSFISACRLLESEKNYNIKMVTFDNGCSVNSCATKDVADRIINMYGSSRASYLGVYSIVGILREFFMPYYNMKPEEQAKAYKGLTPSQFHCLVCRTSMYIASIWIAKSQNAEYIAEGGRLDQQFVIELPGMAKERFPKLVEQAGLKLLLPVYEMTNNWERDNELSQRGFISKTHEPKCMIGCPINGSVDQDVIDGVHLFYDNFIIPKISERNLLNTRLQRTFCNNEYNEFLVPSNNCNLSSFDCSTGLKNGQ